ncbi:hypothetical protein K0M31_012888 [Melipona bicolor]|uniref:Uncharacterized protein n=1 Tax=Melipona bicolor TaxID=60889 RepID=A0AA40FIR9_9HYME|nr:hypothetical protein K0M31_012888 [Melipona bicolor]
MKGYGYFGIFGVVIFKNDTFQTEVLLYGTSCDKNVKDELSRGNGYAVTVHEEGEGVKCQELETPETLTT